MAINRPTTKTIISTTQWGIPITDAVNLNVTDIAALKTATAVTAWTNLVLTNGWTNVGGWGIPQYRKVGDMVQLRGLVSGGAANSSLTTLPVGFRPPDQMTLPYAVNGTGANYLSIQPTGSVQPFVAGYCSLSGLSFSTTA
jgi:hypothetical protein